MICVQCRLLNGGAIWLRGRVRDRRQELGTGGRGLKGHPKGAFSGGEIQRLRRLGHEAHTPNVLVGVSD